MTDLISRRDAIDVIMAKPAWHGSDGSYYYADDIRDALNALPSAERKGKWISLDDYRGKYNDNGYKCSECGEHSDYEENYCPECGADMRGEENDF